MKKDNEDDVLTIHIMKHLKVTEALVIFVECKDCRQRGKVSCAVSETADFECCHFHCELCDAEWFKYKMME
jgi:predicted SAM-dependent methyltransferase